MLTVRNSILYPVIGCFGVLSALVIVEPWASPGQNLKKIIINGKTVSTGVARSDSLLKTARERLQSTVKLTGPGFTYTTSWSDLGASINLGMLGELLVELSKEGSSSARFYFSKRRQNAIPSVTIPITFNSAAAIESLAALKDTIDRDPEDAKFDFKKERVVDESYGLSLDIYGTLTRLDKSLSCEKEKVEMYVEKVPATVTKEKLREIDVSQVLGFFETPYSRMRKDRDRTYNVRLGASRLNGQVILPGEEFSFNAVLGERSEAKGFRYAPVIAGGVLVEGMGGGTCQVASTLYAAAFFSGLIITERQTHSRPSSYIKLGLDATVSYPDLDLKFRNPFEFPVVVHFDVQEGVLRAEIRGRERPYVVTLLRKVVSQQPFPERVIDDPDLPRGESVTTQNGIPGYTVRRYQIIESEKVSYRFQTIDKYPPTTQFVHRGTAESKEAIDAAKAPRPDSHKPYRAVNYLRMVQGPGIWYEKSHE